MHFESFLASNSVRILFYLQQHNDARYSELLKYIGVRSNLSRSLKDLMKKKLIVRTLEDAHPIRTKYRLTEKGIRSVQLLGDLQKIVS